MDCYFKKKLISFAFYWMFLEMMEKEGGQLKNWKGLSFQIKFWNLQVKQGSVSSFLSPPAFDSI